MMPISSDMATSAVAERPVAIRILLVGDQPVLREGLKFLFDREAGFAVVGATAEPDETIKAMRDLEPDIALVSVTGRSLDRMLYTLHVLSVAGNRARTVLLAASAAKTQLAAWQQFGVAGILPIDTSPPVMFASVRSVADGHCWVGQKPVAELCDRIDPPGSMAATDPPDLTPRELEIIDAVRRGATNREIASALGIAVDTVKHHVASIFRKVGVVTRLQLAVFASARHLEGQHEG
jgi:two-component system, NarL family, nitrate/nitrite response regulator NarL